MKKLVFVGNASRALRNRIKNSTNLEDAVLRCNNCKMDTHHKYRGSKEQKGVLTFVYICRICEKEYNSDKRV